MIRISTENYISLIDLTVPLPVSEFVFQNFCSKACVFSLKSHQLALRNQGSQYSGESLKEIHPRLQPKSNTSRILGYLTCEGGVVRRSLTSLPQVFDPLRVRTLGQAEVEVLGVDPDLSSGY